MEAAAAVDLPLSVSDLLSNNTLMSDAGWRTPFSRGCIAWGNALTATVMGGGRNRITLSICYDEGTH